MHGHDPAAGHRAASHRISAEVLDALESPTCAVGADGRIILVNQAWLKFITATGGDAAACGIDADYVAVCSGVAGAGPGEEAHVADGLRAVLAGHLPLFDLEYSCHFLTGRRWFRMQVTPLVGVGAVASHHDVTALRTAERAGGLQALRDPVTGLPNGALVSDRLEQALAEGARTGHLVAVALVEIDHSAVLSLSLGTAASDLLLVSIAERLSVRVRDGDTLARFADDQFVVVWRDLTSIEEAQQLTARLTRAFRVPFPTAQGDVDVTASIGVSVDTWAQTAPELLLAADAAMEDAKRRGPGHVQVLLPEQVDPAGSRMRTEASLRAAMYRDELVLHYQPVVSLTNGTVVGVEALVRWQHPSDGLLGPDVFIPVAEAGGLIVALGAWVLEEACTQAVRWQAQGLLLDMAVNLSTRQVAHPDLLQTLQRVLRETGMDPRHLVLEVTESAVMEDAEAAATVLTSIAALGVSLAIDDFGTGYSSLVYLKRYPIWALKVDRSFVAGLGVNEDDDAIVASVIGLARAVGGSCIAEGVETQEQHAALQVLGCDFGQGWLFGRAVAADEFIELVKRCETEMGQRQQLISQRGDKRDRAGEQRDQAADYRDERGDRRDQAAEQRDQVGDQRDEVGDQRDEVSDRRDLAADQRDEVADERDQAGHRRDQAGQQRDRAADRRDQAATDRDQAADERDEAAERSEAQLSRRESAPSVRQRSALARQEAASDRSRASQDREAGATERDQAEHDRDTANSDRGAGAGERTQAEQEREAALADRAAGASERSQAEHDRNTALADRWAGAGERTRAEDDRNTASADRGASAKERHEAAIDELTGAYMPAAGHAELEREVARARRTRQPLVVAMVQVDSATAIAVPGGPTGVDQLFTAVGSALMRHLRSYDLVIRNEDTQFLCALSGVDLTGAATRLHEVQATLAAASIHVPLGIGLAELHADDSLRDVVARAKGAIEP